MLWRESLDALGGQGQTGMVTCRRWFGRVLVLAIAVATAGCALPRSGPNYAEIVNEEAAAELGFQVIAIDRTVNEVTRPIESGAFSVTFTDTPPEPTSTIARGDVLAVTVWENIDQGLLNPEGIGASGLPQVKVDERGTIFVPYVGALRAEGRTISELRNEIRNRLSDKTLNPQVDVFPVQATARVVSVQGRVGKPGLYPIDKPTHHILPMIARAGGVPEDPEVVRIKLRRGRIQGEISLQDLYDDPSNDVHLRTGDAIIVERDRRIFTALGAVRGPSTVPFPTRDLTVAQALGSVGGLLDQQADPTGVFIFRSESSEVASQLVEGVGTEPVRVAYVLDLTKPGAMFLAQDFRMRDGDTLYLTNAPFVKWLKVLQAIAPVIGFSSQVRNLGNF